MSARGRSMAAIRIHHAALPCVALGGVLLVLLTYAPGLVNADAIDQLTQARTHTFSDWQPPAVSFTWAMLDPVVPGPLGMLLLQNLMFWFGIGAVAVMLGRSLLWASLIGIVVGLYPPIFSSLGTIWKDVAMGSALLLAFALLLRAQRHGSRSALVLGTCVLLYGYSLRHNAAAAILPFAGWAGWLASKHVRRHPAFLAAGVFVGITCVASAEDQLLVDGGHLFPIQQILIHDLTGISVQTSQVLLPTTLHSSGGTPTLEDLRCVYTPDSAVAIFGGNSDVACGFEVQRITEPGAMLALAGTWATAVWTHPAEYVRHRLEVFSEEFGINPSRVCYPLQARDDPNGLGLDTPSAPLNAPALDLFSTVAYDTPLYRGWVYLVLLVGLLPVAIRLGREHAVPGVVLGSSGLLYGLTELVVSTSCDFRLHWWTVLASILLAAMVAAAAARRLPRAARPRLHAA